MRKESETVTRSTDPLPHEYFRSLFVLQLSNLGRYELVRIGDGEKIIAQNIGQIVIMQTVVHEVSAVTSLTGLVCIGDGDQSVVHMVQKLIDLLFYLIYQQ